jgi:uncharacterized membrane protein
MYGKLGGSGKPKTFSAKTIVTQLSIGIAVPILIAVLLVIIL